MSSFEVAHSAPLSVQAADILRAQILRGDFALGQRINEVEVANAPGISRCARACAGPPRKGWSGSSTHILQTLNDTQ